MRAIFAAAWLAAAATASAADASNFFRPAKDTSVDLPADRVYPQGRIFPFSGFSGDPVREKANGFTMHGPVYGDDKLPELAASEKAGLPFVFTIGLDMKFHSDQPVSMSETEIKRAITRQVAAVAGRRSIAWWYLEPEEIRYWLKNEVAYMKAATEAIRAADPLRRPVWMYDPNHRDAEALVQTGAHLDLIGKGSYANYAGYQDRRVWVRWSMEQQLEAIRRLGGKRTPLVVTELYQDPKRSLFRQIPAWVRHDVYCGLIHGGKGVVVWSLFERPEVRESYAIWYEAYATVARQLTGERKLGEVFLFGEPRHDLAVKQLRGPATVTLADEQKTAEAKSLSEREKAGMRLQYPAVSWRELAHGTSRYLFLCNSSREAVRVSVAGYPSSALLEEADTGAAVESTGESLTLDLLAWGVRALRIYERTPAERVD